MNIRGVLAALLVCEGIAVGLSVPVAITVAGVAPARALPVGLGLALGCIVTAGLLRRRWGVLIGSVLQAVAVALGLVVPAMFVVGGAFAVLWVLALRLGRQVERLSAEQPDGPGAGPG